MKSFAEIVCESVPKFDALMLENYEPAVSMFIGSMNNGPFMPEWFYVREAVRKLAEGKAYSPTPEDNDSLTISTKRANPF